VTQAAFAKAMQYLRSGRPRAAVDAFAEVLSVDPDDADAHAWLALALLQSRRLHAARIEAELAVAIRADGPVPLYVLGHVRLAERKWKDAEEVFRRLLEVEPNDAENHRGLAQVFLAQGRKDAALEALERARALAPDSPHVLADIAELHFAAGRIDDAETAAKEALGLHAENADALVVMGHVLLSRGKTDEAREHALTVLRHRPDHPGALGLLVGVKASTSWALGLWWRYNTWLVKLGERVTTVLLVAFAVYQFTLLAVRDFAPAGTDRLVEVAWLCICAYTWFGPPWFRRKLQAEIEPATLRPDF
jgi:tetratricopeptide (TPR) repeat protein